MEDIWEVVKTSLEQAIQFVASASETNISKELHIVQDKFWENVEQRYKILNKRAKNATVLIVCRNNVLQEYVFGCAYSPS